MTESCISCYFWCNHNNTVCKILPNILAILMLKLNGSSVQATHNSYKCFKYKRIFLTDIFD